MKSLVKASKIIVIASLLLWLIPAIFTAGVGPLLPRLNAPSVHGPVPGRAAPFLSTLSAASPSEVRFAPTLEAVDGVLIEYEGRLLNGTVFDSSEGRGPTPMIAGQVIPGFAEALTKMQKGGRYRIHIPAKLGYGASPPAGSPIPADSDLEFDVHVVQIVPNAALMQRAQQEAVGAQPEMSPPQP